MVCQMLYAMVYDFPFIEAVIHHNFVFRIAYSNPDSQMIFHLESGINPDGQVIGIQADYR